MTLSQCWWCLAPVEPYPEPLRRFCKRCDHYRKENW